MRDPVHGQLLPAGLLRVLNPPNPDEQCSQHHSCPLLAFPPACSCLSEGPFTSATLYLLLPTQVCELDIMNEPEMVGDRNAEADARMALSAWTCGLFGLLAVRKPPKYPYTVHCAPISWHATMRRLGPA